MKIRVDSGGKTIKIGIPDGLLLNPVTAMVLPGLLRKYSVCITRKQAMAMIKAIHAYHRKNPGWKLLELKGADGDIVEISI